MASSKKLLPLLAKKGGKERGEGGDFGGKGGHDGEKKGKKKKGGGGIWQHERLKKKERDASLPQNTFDSRRAYHATTARVQRNDAKRERERETLLLLFGYTDEKPKDDDDFENTRSKV